MTKEIRFLLISLFIILTRAYDAYSTFGYTPDLENEANPLVSLFGFTWTPLLVVLTILLVYALVAYYQATFNEYPFFPEESGYNFEEFSTFLYLGKKDKWLSFFYKLPNSFRRFNQYMGRFLTWCLVFAGGVSTIMWLLINNTDGYLRDYHSAEVIYAILILGCAGLIWAGHRGLYLLYQQNEKSN